MIFLIDLSLPLKDPVTIFSLVLFIILFSPILFERLRIPSIIGLIAAGILVGPYGLNLLQRDSSIQLFGTIGLLYIMFLAGLEIDLNDFKKNRNRSMAFGFLTFSIPMIIGSLAGYYVLHFNLTSSILLASMFASHTLLTYPLLSRFGLTKNESVSITVGGTMITDTAALLVLAVIAGGAKGELNAQFWIKLVVSLTIFVFIVLWGVPRLGKWFFRNMESEGGSQFLFVLTVVFGSAFLAELAGVEPIIGAFLAGLALNRLIPHTSPLMNRLEFVGNTLFIPFFLLSVGMLVNIEVIFKGPEALIVAATMIVVVIVAKWLAAFATQKIFGYSKVEKNIIFGLSVAQAAATLAAVLIGYNLKILNESVLNGTILMILATCLVSSFVTQSAGRKLAIIESEKAPDLSEIPERILIPISQPEHIDQLMDLAVMIKDVASEEPLYPMVVVRDNADTKEEVLRNTKMLEKAKDVAAATEHTVQVTSKVDHSVAGGILKGVKELMISTVVLAWDAKRSTRERIFGSVLDQALLHSEQMFLVSRLLIPLNTVDRIMVVMPQNAEIENGYEQWLATVKNLARQIGAPIGFFGHELSLERLKANIIESKPAIEANYTIFDDWSTFPTLSKHATPNDLIIVVSARKGTLTYNHYLDKVPRQLPKCFGDTSFVIIYPQQTPIDYFDRLRELEQWNRMPIGGTFKRFTKAGLWIRRVFKSRKTQPARI